ncbi:hypothetical protein Poli38472_011519 [Pythium oligandrum]|uniref:Glycoside hydrolase family 5 domain-containing protein n=1 Tax=Pythium oligandrum TaxID=41045 RepID=A0A8K1CKB1_PYTOL|nr:hypothetical protein Poli38472_011519 [Pythium oligandrum]|eukprot:TMW64639.1 hypothetical protein Poli38472_011519 [Pythium oligandrum]
MADVEKDVGANRPTYVNSEFPSGQFRYSEDAMLLDTNNLNSSRMTMSGGLGSGMRQTEMKITAIEPDDASPPERKKDYKGRIRTWPGILLFIGIVGAAVALITLEAVDAKNKAADQAKQWELNQQGNRKIQDGLNSSNDLIEDDGQIGNPKKYPDMGCELPNYQSKNGQIWAVAENGTEVPVGIKGVNWFGMETGLAIPFGLWENQENGTSVYEVASFLARNKFNSVRLPVCVENILKDTAPMKDLVNLNTNRAMNISTYMTTLQSIIEALAYRHVSVMISVHTLTTKSSGGAWYSAALGVTEDEFLTAIDKLTSNLCTDKYWNILGLDLKNEPHECSWGGAEPDWQKGATLIGNRMLKGCPKWMAFVEGINKEHSFTLDGKTKSYFDWWGGGLQNADKNPVELAAENKVVYAPHYYNTGVNPAWYLYGGGTVGANNILTNYVELDDATLKANVKATMDDMFGFLAKKKKEAVVLGEFAGLYAKDKHPLKTTKRTTDFTIEVALEEEFAGAYMWSLNPESAYQFNPADTYGHFTEGLLTDDWLSPDTTFLEGMAPLDRIKDLKMFPCFPKEIKE